MFEEIHAGRRERLPILTTPRGALMSPQLSDPDYGDDAQPKPNGEFWTRFVIDPTTPATARFLRELEGRWRDAVDKARIAARGTTYENALRINPLSFACRDEEDGAPTSKRVLRFGMRATDRGVRDDGGLRRPVVFNAGGRPFWRAPAGLDGRTAKVSFQPCPYFLPDLGVAGMKLRLIAVMLCADEPSDAAVTAVTAPSGPTTIQAI